MIASNGITSNTLDLNPFSNILFPYYGDFVTILISLFES